jgi:hypothetical protein
MPAREEITSFSQKQHMISWKNMVTFTPMAGRVTFSIAKMERGNIINDLESSFNMSIALMTSACNTG